MGCLALTTIQLLTLTFATIVTILYWSVLYKGPPANGSVPTLKIFVSISVHALNLVFVIVEFSLNNLKPDWWQIMFAPIFVFLYGCWAAIGSVAMKNQNQGELWFPYPFLDYRKTKNLGFMALILVGVTISGVFWVAAYKLKNRAVKKRYSSVRIE